jgi:chromate transport protein ChrA
MPELSLIMALLASFTFYLMRMVTDEIEKTILQFIGAVCLLVSLFNAPWVILLLVTIGLLIVPTCSHPSHQPQPACSRFCFMSSQCRVSQ